jgi:hypothetical protein
MEYRSDLATAESAAAAPARRYYRHKIQNLAYVNLDQGNGGIIRDLNEHGLAIQAVAPLRSNQQVYLRFELLSPRVRIEASGRVAWANSTSQAGVEFATLPQRSRVLLREWIFTQLLSTAHHVAWNSIFSDRKRHTDAAELAFSSTPRMPIELDREITALSDAVEHRASHLQLLGLPLGLSAGAVARLIDALIVISATLLFFIVALAVTHVFPGWTVVLPLGAVVAAVFSGVYCFVFKTWIGCTPGTQLAGMMGVGEMGDSEEDDRARFR